MHLHLSVAGRNSTIDSGWFVVGKGHEQHSRNDFHGNGEVPHDADSLTENEISSSATITAQPSTTTTLSKTFISVFHLKTSSASLTANLILNILLAHSYRAIM